MIEIFGIVQDALAGVAGDDLIVLADFLENLRPDANLADFAHLFSRRSDCDAATVLCEHDRNEESDLVKQSLRFPCAPSDKPSSALMSRLFSSSSCWTFDVDFLLILLEVSFGGLDLGLNGFRFHHEVENFVFNLSDVFLRMFDLMLQRAIFVVGFYRHHLLAVFRNLRFDAVMSVSSFLRFV